MNPIIYRPVSTESFSVQNHRTGLCYAAMPASALPQSEQNIRELESICNQPAIYNILFRERLSERPYTVDDARVFLDWAASGFREQRHFVFIVISPEQLPVAAIDIKSADRAAAEIGYWCSSEHRGLMSEAVSGLIVRARQAQFQMLYAHVRRSNLPSIRVLERNGFQLRGEAKGPEYFRYELDIL